MRYIATVLLVSLLSSVPAFAQDEPRPPRLIISDAAVAKALAEHPPARVQSSRDSVKNGALIGAIAGAAVFGGFVTYLCNALREPSDPSCWKSTALAIGMGAGGGALAGAGLDALFVRSAGTSVPWRNTQRLTSEGYSPRRH